jgi:hypothetical protein
MRRLHIPSLLALVTVTFAAAVGAAAEPPVAPSPEVFVVDRGVEPATLTTAVPSASAPVPLTSSPTDGPRPVAARPLPDWRILAALGAAFAALAGYRAFTSRRIVALPPDVFEVLGEASLGGQQSVRIVRFGPRTLLVGVSAAGCQTLAELTDAQATDAIVTACRGVGVARSAERRPRRRETRA